MINGNSDHMESGASSIVQKLCEALVMSFFGMGLISIFLDFSKLELVLSGMAIGLICLLDSRVK